MIISKQIYLPDLLSHIKSTKELVSYVDSTIQPHHRGIKFIEDNQFYYCAIIIHNQLNISWERRKTLIEALTKDHCAFGAIGSFNELGDITQYANKSLLVSLLRKDSSYG